MVYNVAYITFEITRRTICCILQIPDKNNKNYFLPLQRKSKEVSFPNFSTYIYV